MPGRVIFFFVAVGQNNPSKVIRSIERLRLACDIRLRKEQEQNRNRNHLVCVQCGPYCFSFRCLFRTVQGTEHIHRKEGTRGITHLCARRTGTGTGTASSRTDQIRTRTGRGRNRDQDVPDDNHPFFDLHSKISSRLKTQKSSIVTCWSCGSFLKGSFTFSAVIAQPKGQVA